VGKIRKGRAVTSFEEERLFTEGGLRVIRCQKDDHYKKKERNYVS